MRRLIKLALAAIPALALAGSPNRGFMERTVQSHFSDRQALALASSAFQGERGRDKQRDRRNPPTKRKNPPPKKQNPPARERTSPTTAKTNQNKSNLERIRIQITREEKITRSKLGGSQYGDRTHGAVVRTLPKAVQLPRLRTRPTPGIRTGYFPYQPTWRDSQFVYPYYAFTYDRDLCVVSPWYFYWQMPAYILVARVSFGPFLVDYVGLHNYSWRPLSYDLAHPDPYCLDVAIDRLVRVYEDQDLAALDRLVPEGYQVNIDLGFGDRYLLDSEDFHDMLLDNVTTTETRSFRILRVQEFRAGAKIEAVHTYTNPAGFLDQTRHTYLLQLGDHGYRITSLKVDRSMAPF